MSQTVKFYDVPVSSQTHLLAQTKAWTICSRCQTPWWCPSKSDTLNLLLKTGVVSSSDWKCAQDQSPTTWIRVS